MLAVLLAAVAAAPAGAAVLTSGLGGESCFATGASARCWSYFPASTGPGGIREIAGSAGATSVSAAGQFTCATVTGGAVACWGFWRQLVLGPSPGGTVPEPASLVSGVEGATTVEAGATHACAIVAGGQVRCWGTGSMGELGNGATQDSLVAVAVKGISGATAIAASYGRTCVLVGGVTWCWGTGIGATPRARSGVPAATAITLGTDHACVLTLRRTVSCWGDGGGGRLGDGTGLDSATAVEVRGLSRVRAIAAGADDTCALIQRGAVACWGPTADSRGGSIKEADVPAPVEGVRGASAISATCALIPKVAVRCWGYDPSRVPAASEPWGVRTVIRLGSGRIPPPGPGAWLDGARVELVAVSVRPAGACPRYVRLEVRVTGEVRSRVAATTRSAGRCRVSAGLTLTRVPRGVAQVTISARAVRARTLTLARL